MRNPDGYWLTGSALGLCLAAIALLAQAEITTDGSMGVAGALEKIDGNFAIIEELGSLRGANLFHSFGVFDVGVNESATFSGRDSISNIIGRVTGGTVSNIDGLLQSTIPDANLYLVNPAGVMFGAEARLDVQGSFHVSTADYLDLADGGRFEADVLRNSVLTSAPPAAYGFLDAENGAITVGSNLLEVPWGKTISLIGGDIATSNSIILARGGRINVASVASAGMVTPTADDLVVDSSELGSINIEHPGPAAIRKINGRDTGNLDVSATTFRGSDPAGNIYIRAKDLRMDNGWIFSDTRGYGAGGSIDVSVDQLMHMLNEARITVDSFGYGAGGEIMLRVGGLELDSGSVIRANVLAFGAESGGKININARDFVNVSGASEMLPNLVGEQSSGIRTRTLGGGAGGTIVIDAPLFSVSDGADVSSFTEGAGNGGKVTVLADHVELAAGGRLTANTLDSGNGGGIELNITGDILANGSSGDQPSGIFSNSFSSGNAGDIRIVAGRLVLTEGAGIQAGIGDSGIADTPPATAASQAGEINITVDALLVADGAQISTQSENAGQAGNILVAAADLITISGSAGEVPSGLFSTSTGSGHGGDVTLNAGRLSVRDGGAINVSTSAAGDAGTITVNADDVLVQSGGQISTSTSGSGNAGGLRMTSTQNLSIDGQGASGFRSGIYSLAEGSGEGGDVHIGANRVDITDHGIITAQSDGSGDAGNITLNVATEIHMDNGEISTQALQADGGNITINTRDMLYLHDSKITAAVGTGFGDGGNIEIDPAFVVLDSSAILANAFGGAGGNIHIVADHFIASSDSVLDASSALGIDGSIEIDSPDVDLESGLTVLPEDYLNAIAMLRERCGARKYAQRNSFVVAGRQGVPPAPDGAAVYSSAFADDVVEVAAVTDQELALRQRLPVMLPTLALNCTADEL